MIPQERRKQILSLLSSHGYMTVEELAERIYVSVPTIRRDLAALAEEGSVRRVHGGASHVSREAFEWPFDLRDRVNLPEKRVIGSLAAKLAEDGDHIFIDSGSTCHFMVEALKPEIRLTALSNCVPTIQALSAFRNITIECPCGQYEPSHASVFGSEAADFIRTRYARYYFASATGMDLKTGVNVRTLMDMPVKKSMRERAEKMVLLMDHTKMGEANYYTAFAFSEIDILVTDCPLPQEIADRCARENIAVITPKSRNGF
ncbi:MAG: DeoR/GlpR transcriptional regulator [Oscillibacter sp.]|nr:DeoR/GlpR transcriptional regulator [Oscillibacter sp.]